MAAHKSTNQPLCMNVGGISNCSEAPTVFQTPSLLAAITLKR